MTETKRNWYDISVEQAHAEFGSLETGLIGSDVILPLNEMGEECPWPYDPQQLVGAPMGQYHCPYCGAMVMAGMKHLDYRPQPMFALLTRSGTAISDTAICGKHKDTVTGHSIAVGNASQWAPDWDGNEELTDCTGNDELSCQICGTPHETEATDGQ